jgi:drug/metabolite transporter (DMT)-like permease
MPKTRLGKWAGGFLAGFLVLILTIVLGKNHGIRLGSPQIYILGICAAIAGMAAFVAGALSFFKLKDRSIVVALATVLGAVVTLISIMELVEGIIWRSTH